MSRVGIVAGAAATRTTLGEPRFPTFFAKLGEPST